MGIPENIDALLVRDDITAETLARIVGVSAAAVSGWRHGSVPREDAVARICDYFRLTRDDIMSDSAGLAAKSHSLSGKIPSNAITPSSGKHAYAPLLGRVHAGKETEPEVLDAAVELPASVHEGHPNAYFLEVEGDCMDHVYPEGCFVLVDPDREPSNGSVAAVVIDGHDAVMRRLYRGASTLVLSPDSNNSTHDDIIISTDDERVVELVGTVVWFQPRREME